MTVNDPDLAHPFDNLDPDTILNAVETYGLVCTGGLLALNSYENRVYQVALEGDPAFVVVKFYRPQRWSAQAIREEHAFSRALYEAEIPAVPPLLHNGDSLHQVGNFYFAVYPRRGGRWPELDISENRVQLGRFLGRLHALGAARPFAHRLSLNVQRWADESAQYLLAGDWIPEHIRHAYETLVADLIPRLHARWESCVPVRMIRLHGDCHPGNILWTDSGPHFVDFDDAINGPALQDLWMLLSGPREEMQQQLTDLLEGYTDFMDFDPLQLHLLEVLRSLRLMHYAAWLARRWHDPAFPHSFPWFNTARYWEEHILSLREQLAALDEAPLTC